MDKSVIRLSYILGIFLGICLSLLALIITYKSGIFSLEKVANKSDEIYLENEKLKKELLEKNNQINEIIEKNAKKDIKQVDKLNDSIVIDIKKDMTNDKIADLIIQNGVYKHKNDLMMLLEILNFNRVKYGDVLEEYSVISSSYEFNKQLNKLENNQYAAAEYLYSSKMIQDRASFMKIIYLLSPSSSIKYGKKEFVKDSSLREIGDVLIN